MFHLLAQFMLALLFISANTTFQSAHTAFATEMAQPNLLELAKSNAPFGIPKNTDYTSLNPVLFKNSYVLSFNCELKNANWVSWNLSGEDFGLSKRSSKYHSETNLPRECPSARESSMAYSGFDRGHLIPSADRTASTDANFETFSMANMIPQVPESNRRSWKALETFSRKRVELGEKLTIVAGGLGSLGTLQDGVNIPALVWKVIVAQKQVPFLEVQKSSNLLQPVNSFFPSRNEEYSIAAIFPNDTSAGDGRWQDFITSIDDIENQTGFNFFPNLTQETQNRLEQSFFEHAQYSLE